MVYLTNKQKLNLIPKQQQRDIIKYGTGLRHGQALYLPRRRVEGESLADIIGFISRNSDTIKNIGSTVGSVVGALGSTAGTIIEVVKKARELNQQGISNKVLEKVVNTKDESAPKSGTGFYYID